MMKKLLIVIAALAVGSLSAEAAANSTISVVNNETKLAGKNSAFSGRVLDENGEVLPGAVISIADLGVGAITDAQGYFYISNITPGNHKVAVNYVGYSTIDTQVDFAASTNVEAEIKISAGIELGSVEVKGIVSGRRKALQQQSAEAGVSNIISSDQMSRFPDDNIGDAMKRIPGINVQYDQGEARFGQVRGTAPDLSSVTVNGNRTPSAEGGTRSAQLDLIPADMIETVEVRKVVTADMDGDAIGGAVNLVTKSAPSRQMANASFGMGYNAISNKVNYNGSVSAGKRFFDDKLGVVAAISYSNNPIGSDNTEAEWVEGDNGEAVLDVLENRQYFVQRERQSYSLSTDFKFNANHKLEFKGMYNRRNDWENRYKYKMKNLSETNDDGEIVAKISRQTKGGGEDERYTRLEQQQTQSYNLSGEHRFNRLEMDWNVDYSTASELRPNERYITFEQKEVVTVNSSNESLPTVTLKESANNALNSNNYELDCLELSNQDVRETEIKAAVNFKYDISSGKYGNSLRFGYKIQEKDKKMDIEYYKVKPTDSYEDEFVSKAFANVSDQTRSNFMVGNYALGEFVNREFLGNIDMNNSSNFEKEHILAEELANYSGSESIQSAYLRFDQKLGDKLSAIAGFRLENTYYDYTRTITNQNATRVENDYLPSLLLKYTPTKELIIRGSYTSTIARPSFEALIPGSVVDNDEEEIFLGNTEITNTSSNNFDLMAEYYTKNAALFSAGIYYKEIKDFIVETSMKEKTEGHEYEGYKYKQFINGGDGYILGVEAAVQTDLAFVSSSLKNFGIYTNYTFNHSQVTKLADNDMLAGQTTDDMALPGSPKHIVNASLYYENKRFSAAIAYNFSSSYLDEMGGSQFENRYYDKTSYLDFNLSVKATKWLTVYGELGNILNQPLRYYQGTESRLMQVEYYGMRGTLGVKANF